MTLLLLTSLLSISLLLYFFTFYNYIYDFREGYYTEMARELDRVFTILKNVENLSRITVRKW